MTQFFRDAIADFVHNQWSNWMRYLFSKCTENDDGTMTIPTWAVERWKRQMSTDFASLPFDEQETDLKEADKFLLAYIRARPLRSFVNADSVRREDPEKRKVK